ncbi:hypothetical protein CYY_006223 [Polysphondylium violaceum]|uniref:RING-type domain-containing protein n=1 Tax=Polysphondylium violaceum TaxID=133409 RepID=A0A8J4PQW4_9MYCE|nr:hypothetical protein CYY_006223 [Polysphondylium violaceum]
MLKDKETSSKQIDNNNNNNDDKENITTLGQDKLYTYPNDQELNPDYECSICLQLLIDPVVEPNCRNIYCRDCLTKSLDNDQDRCPTCREPTSIHQVYLPPRFITNYLNEIKVLCSVCNQQEPIKRSCFDYHIEHECQTPCPHGCGQSFNKVGHQYHFCIKLQQKLQQQQQQLAGPPNPYDIYPMINMMNNKIEALSLQCDMFTTQIKQLQKIETFVMLDNKVCKDCNFLFHPKKPPTEQELKFCKVIKAHNPKELVSSQACSKCTNVICTHTTTNIYMYSYQIYCKDCCAVQNSEYPNNWKGFLSAFPDCKKIGHTFVPFESIDQLIDLNK